MMRLLFYLLPRNAEAVYRLVFGLLPVLYFVLYAPYGLDETDQGFVAALAYRVTLGELPHVDFMYVRPALTPLLHSLELLLLPEQLEMIGMRFIGVFYLWLSVLFSVLTLQRLFDFRELYVSPWLLGALGFVLAVHNYPPMAWHTIDALLFTALGTWCMVRFRNWWGLALGLLVLGLAPLCKQPFAVVPLAGLVVAASQYPRREFLRGLLAIIGFGALAGALLWRVYPGPDFFREMVAQSFGATDPAEIVGPGAWQYLKVLAVVGLPFGLVWLLVKLWRKQVLLGRLVWGGLGVAFIGFLGVQVFQMYDQKAFVAPGLGFAHALVGLGICLAVIFRWTGEKNMGWVLVMLAGSWASGISWGYATPVLYVVPGLFVLVYFLGLELGQRPPRMFFPAGVVLALIGYFVLYQYPYREQERGTLTYHLGDHFQKLSHIYTHRTRYERYGELKDLQLKYGDGLTVLPALPLANYLTDTRPVISVDWAHDAEMAYGRGLERILQEMEVGRPVVLVDKVRGPAEAQAKRRQYRSSLTAEVLAHWKIIEETEYYYVCEHP